MKKTFIAKITGILLGIVLVISVGGNIYLLKNTSDAREEVVVIRNELVTADNQIADLQAQVDDLQGQLTESRKQIESLESTIAENNTTIADLERQLAEQEQLLLEAQEQAQAKTVSSQSNSSSNTSSNNKSSSENNDPGYQGEKEGYSYIPGFGYVSNQDDPGAVPGGAGDPLGEDDMTGEKIGDMQKGGKVQIRAYGDTLKACRGRRIKL